MKYFYLFIVMMTTVVLLAADRVGRVSSSGPLTLNGKALPATAASSLPVVVGDEIATSSSPAMIYFIDKSRATIAPNSRVKLEAHSSSVALRVLSGVVDLKQAAGSRISLLQAINSAAPKPAVALASSPASASAGHPTPPPPPRPPPPRPPPPPPPPPPPRSPHCPPGNPS